MKRIGRLILKMFRRTGEAKTIASLTALALVAESSGAIAANQTSQRASSKPSICTMDSRSRIQTSSIITTQFQGCRY